MFKLLLKAQSEAMLRWCRGLVVLSSLGTQSSFRRGTRISSSSKSPIQISITRHRLGIYLHCTPFVHFLQTQLKKNISVLSTLLLLYHEPTCFVHIFDCTGFINTYVSYIHTCILRLLKGVCKYHILY